MPRFDLRMVSSLSFVLLAFGFGYQANFTTQADLYTIMMARFLQGFGILFFFLPLVQLSLGEIAPERYASAAGLFNFIRILIGSGFGTSLSIELWTRREIFHHARLSETMTAAQPVVNQVYQKLGTEFSPDVITRIVDRGVEQQAYMLSTNELSWLGAWMLLSMIPLVYLCKRVKAPTAKVEVVH